MELQETHHHALLVCLPGFWRSSSGSYACKEVLSPSSPPLVFLLASLFFFDDKFYLLCVTIRDNLREYGFFPFTLFVLRMELRWSGLWGERLYALSYLSRPWSSSLISTYTGIKVSLSTIFTVWAFMCCNVCFHSSLTKIYFLLWFPFWLISSLRMCQFSQIYVFSSFPWITDFFMPSLLEKIFQMSSVFWNTLRLWRG